MMRPPVGKSGPRTMPSNARTSSSGRSISATVASTSSVRLCGGMFVAMPTAMPTAPLSSRLGTRVGRTLGSSSLSS